jgi:cold shock CspA family protein
LKVPDDEIVVSRNPDAENHRDIYVAVHDAFDTLQRKLQDYVQRKRRYVKRDIRPPRGKIIRILREGNDGYGFIQTEDGREIYFHQNSVLNDHFDDLTVGTEVRYAEENGESGPQASTVELAS